MEQKIVMDRIRGSLIGGAVGDALGYEIEFDREPEIFRRFGKSGITEYVLNRTTGTAIISDDTQMTLFTANGILYEETRRYTSEGFRGWSYGVCDAYADWLTTQMTYFEGSRGFLRAASWLCDVPELFERRAPGNTCLMAMKERVRKGGELQYPRNGYIASVINNSKGCGGVMRTAPVGLCRSDKSLDEITIEGAEAGAITHNHPMGYVPAGVLAHIVRQLAYAEQKPSLRTVVEKAIADMERIFHGTPCLDTFSALLKNAAALAYNDADDLTNIHQLGEGWVGDEALAIAIYCCLRHEDDFSACIISSVNHNGDSDSTGAIAGNILGALVGYEAIEDKWKQHLELSDVILEIADDLSAGRPAVQDGSITDQRWYQKYAQKKSAASV